VQAIVRKAQYSDPRATDYIVGTLIKRRDKVLKAWLAGVNPLVNPRLSGDGILTFENAAAAAKVAPPAERYAIAWSAFDNATATHKPVGEDTTVAEPRAQAPPALLTGSEYVAATVRSLHPQHPRWAEPVVMYFRRAGAEWHTVGLERGAEVRRATDTETTARR
jgi:hypothetical protein